MAGCAGGLLGVGLGGVGGVLRVGGGVGNGGGEVDA